MFAQPILPLATVSLDFSSTWQILQNWKKKKKKSGAEEAASCPTAPRGSPVIDSDRRSFRKASFPFLGNTRRTISFPRFPRSSWGWGGCLTWTASLPSSLERGHGPGRRLLKAPFLLTTDPRGCYEPSKSIPWPWECHVTFVRGRREARDALSRDWFTALNWPG